MSDVRRPDITLRLKGSNGVNHRFELFRSAQFTRGAFATQTQYEEGDVPTVRVRHNGTWLPVGEQQLMTLDQALTLVKSACARNLIQLDKEALQ